MMAQSGGCGCGGIGTEQRSDNEAAVKTKNEKDAVEKSPELIDYTVTLLIAAGAAMTANCEPCLNKIVPDLIEARVSESDIRRAVKIGQFVKNKAADNMKEVADVLAGTNYSDKRPASDEGCPADRMKQ
ncbi:MAG: hypothetical protein Kow0099_35940 [Candidatus Abyssubacteria bacterium]